MKKKAEAERWGSCEGEESQYRDEVRWGGERETAKPSSVEKESLQALEARVLK